MEITQIYPVSQQILMEEISKYKSSQQMADNVPSMTAS